MWCMWEQVEVTGTWHRRKTRIFVSNKSTTCGMFSHSYTTFRMLRAGRALHDCKASGKFRKHIVEQIILCPNSEWI